MLPFCRDWDVAVLGFVAHALYFAPYRRGMVTCRHKISVILLAICGEASRSKTLNESDYVMGNASLRLALCALARSASKSVLARCRDTDHLAVTI